MTADLHAQLAAARTDLEAFEAQVTSGLLLRRLQHENARHPLLVGYTLLRAAASVMGIATCAVVSAPWLGDDALRLMAALPLSTSLPFLGMASALAFVMAAVFMRSAAIARGEVSPLLPGEHKRHQRLAGKVAQLQCAIEVGKRTPGPASVRVTHRAA